MPKAPFTSYSRISYFGHARPKLNLVPINCLTGKRTTKIFLNTILVYGNGDILWTYSQQTQNICITFIQRWPNVFDVGPTLYKCYTNVLCLQHAQQNTKHLYNICTTSAQRLRRWPNIVQMLYKCFVLAVKDP